MTEPDPLLPIRRRLTRLEIENAAQDYATPERISYIADLDGARAYFVTTDRYSHAWFYPRYANGALHEPNLTRLMFDSFNADSVFVDVGAHLGYFSIIAALKAQAVFAIEPQEFLIGRIHANISANHFSNVTLLHAAVGSAPGFANIPKIGNPTTRVGQSDNLVPMIRLDDYFTGLHCPTHLKIDTEGFEFHVLSGARKILETRPTLFIEYHRGMERFGPSGEEMWDLLTAMGYSIGVGNHRRGNAGFNEVSRADLPKYAGAMLICEAR